MAIRTAGTLGLCILALVAAMATLARAGDGRSTDERFTELEARIAEVASAVATQNSRIGRLELALKEVRAGLGEAAGISQGPAPERTVPLMTITEAHRGAVKAVFDRLDLRFAPGPAKKDGVEAGLPADVLAAWVDISSAFDDGRLPSRWGAPSEAQRSPLRDAARTLVERIYVATRDNKFDAGGRRREAYLIFVLFRKAVEQFDPALARFNFDLLLAAFK